MSSIASSLRIPDSSVCISVKIIDTTTISNIPVAALLDPPLPGLERLPPAPSFSFLLEHPDGHKLLFDLGVPKDISVLGSAVAGRLKDAPHRIDVSREVCDVLEGAGIQKREINAVIWSHTHWDHKGDTAAFPDTTDLVVGPGTVDTFIKSDSGNSALGGVEKREIEGRRVREIDFKDPSCLKIGQFSAFDYFSDGSLYLLDSPGHSVGHLCALVRTTTKPSTFVFLGGDAVHHCAEFRPSQYLPMPDSISPNPISGKVQTPYCPGTLFTDHNVQHGRPPHGSLAGPKWAADMDVALRTIEKMQECDGDEDVLVLFAHDATIRHSSVPFFPDPVNDWKSRGLGRDLKWAWIGNIVKALKGVSA